MRLEEIGFYTLSDDRAAASSRTSPMIRGEILLTGKCNFRCPYCRGLPDYLKDDADLNDVLWTLDRWCDDGLKNVRFSGGEPMCYGHLGELVDHCRERGVGRIAISTNGSFPLKDYLRLIDRGANDFSISLDACCASLGGKMAGIPGKWECVVHNIGEIAKLVYVSCGVVITDDNVHDLVNTVRMAHDLGVADIRIISSAQYNRLLEGVAEIPKHVLESHPILAYRVGNLLRGRNVRGIEEYDNHRCPLVLDDSAVCNGWHFPCVIYLRERGNPIGRVSYHMREKREEWAEHHDTFEDPICRRNCLDVCIDYNNRWASLHRKKKLAGHGIATSIV